MDLSAALAHDLALLSGTIDGGSVDIAATVASTAREARAAVGSYVGMTVLTGPGDADLRFTVLDAGVVQHDIRASLHVAFRADVAAGKSVVIFYASIPGAFVDLAADIMWLTDLRPGDVVTDEHLSLPTTPDSAGTVAAGSVVDQAVGALLSQGRAPAQARADLARRSAQENIDVVEAARRTLADLTEEPTDDDPH